MEKFGIEKELDGIKVSLESFVNLGILIPAIPDYETIVEIYTNEVVGFKSTMVELTDKYKEKYGDAWSEKESEIKELIAAEKKKTIDYYMNEGRQFLEGLYKTLIEAFKKLLKKITEVATDVVKKITEAVMPTTIGVGAPNPLSIILKLFIAITEIKKQLDIIALLGIKLIDVFKQIGILDLVETMTGGIADFKKSIDAKKAAAVAAGSKIKEIGVGLNPAELKNKLDWTKTIDMSTPLGQQITAVKSLVNTVKSSSDVVESNNKAIAKSEAKLKKKQQAIFSAKYYADQKIFTIPWPAGGTEKPGSAVMEIATKRYDIAFTDFPLNAVQILRLINKSNDIEAINGQDSDLAWRELIIDFNNYMNGYKEWAKTAREFEEDENGTVILVSGSKDSENTGGGEPGNTGSGRAPSSNNKGGVGTANDGSGVKTPEEGDNPK